MLDAFGRDITKLRISVTDRCNLHCLYCTFGKNIEWIDRKKILSFEEISDVAKVAVELGITSIRLTGGEPLVRKNIVLLVSMLHDISGIKDLSMTTNGILLPKYASDLKQAGLNRINISLDTLNNEKFREITGGESVAEVLEGIERAIKVGFSPIKINCVVKESSSEEDAMQVKEYAENKGLKARFIRLMNLETGDFSVVEGGEGGNCKICNRLRLLCDGTIRPCLFSDIGFNVKKYGIMKAFELALLHKPMRGGSCSSHQMHQIGG